MQVVGDLKSAGNIRIEGRVNGEIHAQAVDVSPGALIDGSINALAIQIGGSVKGRVEAKQVKIQNSGEMLGDVLYEALEIESGATGVLQAPGIKAEPTAGNRSWSQERIAAPPRSIDLHQRLVRVPSIQCLVLNGSLETVR
jgi:cytoskeletal protein CcmA (bactofilin family)